MSVRRLHWQGTTRQRLLRERFDAALAGWLEAWSAAPARPASATAQVGATPVDACLRWHRAGGRIGTLWVGASPEALDALGGRLADAHSDDGLGLGRRVGERALRDLVGQWLGGGASLDDFAPAAAPDEADLDARHGACRFVLDAGVIELHVLLDDALCAHLLPEARGARVPLATRAACVAAEPVTLDLMLDFGTATLADAHGLQVGDVLVSRTRLDALFHIAQPGGRRLAGAHLHRLGDRRALRVCATSQDDKAK
jgi:hypothetical protein